MIRTFNQTGLFSKISGTKYTEERMGKYQRTKYGGFKKKKKFHETRGYGSNDLLKSSQFGDDFCNFSFFSLAIFPKIDCSWKKSPNGLLMIIIIG